MRRGLNAPFFIVRFKPVVASDSIIAGLNCGALPTVRVRMAQVLHAATIVQLCCVVLRY